MVFRHTKVKLSLCVCVFLFWESFITVSNISVLLLNLSSLLLSLMGRSRKSHQVIVIYIVNVYTGGADRHRTV